MSRTISIAAVTAAAFVSISADAAISLPAIESFDSDAANWFNSNSTDVVDWVATGGADGGGYVTTGLEIPEFPPPFGITLFRGQDEFGSSDGIFEGDWAAAGVTELRFSVRHDAPIPLTFFSRMSSPVNFPSAIGLNFAPILPGQWTEVSIDLTEGNPSLVLAGATYGEIFSNIGHIQIGMDTPDLPVGTALNIDLDSVQVVPAPGALAMIACFGVAGRRRRRG